MAKNISITLTVDYGYDTHSIDISIDLFKKIKSGLSIELKGAGFHIEGEITQDFWKFNDGSVHVLCDNGFEIFSGSIDDIEVLKH